jgi:phosphoribosylanthranilate isomerase
MTQAKICGLSTPQTVEAALVGGAAYLGFVIFPASPRHVDPATAGRLAAPARGRAAVVAVTVDPSDEALERIRADLKPDLIQLHGQESPARVKAAGERAQAGTIKALPVASAQDLAAARAYEAAATHLMFDAKTAPGSALPGGMGEAFDWTLLSGARFARPWFLAGGLDAWNVAEAIAVARPPVVDVSSGVERGPGLKDAALIAQFLDAVRRA